MARPDSIVAALEVGRRPDREGWRSLVAQASLSALSAAADRLRARLHPGGDVGYVIDRNVNYSNVCAVVCTFCAFYRRPGAPDGYVLSHEQIFRKVEEMQALGGSGILMQGGLHPELPLEWYTALLSELRRRFGIYLHCFSPPEIHHFSLEFGMSHREVLSRLKEAGLCSLPGGGAEILVDRVRSRVSTKCTAGEWLAVMEAAHGLGLPTTATMMFGIGETDQDRLEHLERLHALQEKTGGFIAFIPWTFQPDNTALGRRVRGRLPPEVYLRWLAVSRLYLDNVPNVQVSWLTQGLEVARQGLHSGANDLGSVMIEENVITPAGAHHRATVRQLREAIIAEGFSAFERDAGYRRLSAPGRTLDGEGDAGARGVRSYTRVSA